MKPLSPAQLSFLARVGTLVAYRTPFTGNSQAGRVASAWYRTADSLAERGLIELRRTGDAQTATITPAGREALQSGDAWPKTKTVNCQWCEKPLRGTRIEDSRSARFGCYAYQYENHDCPKRDEIGRQLKKSQTAIERAIGWRK